MSLWMKTAKRSMMLLPLAGMAGLAAHAQDASAVSAYVDSSYLFLIGGLIVMFLILEPHGLAQLWRVAKEKLRLWPFPH